MQSSNQHVSNWITSNLHKNMNKLTQCDPRFLDVIVSDLAFAAIVKVLITDYQQPHNL